MTSLRDSSSSKRALTNADTAERLAEQALRISNELNELVRDIQGNEPDDEFVRLRAAIGRVM